MALRAALGPPTLALAAFVALALALSYAALVYWVYHDAAARGSAQPRTWAAAVGLFSPAVVVYLLKRRSVGPRTRPESDQERLARVLASSVLLAWVVAAAAAPPDPITQLYYAGATLAVGVALGTFLVVHLGVGGRGPTA